MAARMNNPIHTRNRKDALDRKDNDRRSLFHARVASILALSALILGILIFYSIMPLLNPTIDEKKLEISYLTSDREPSYLIDIGEIFETSADTYVAYDETGCVVTDIWIKNSNNEEGVVTGLTLHAEDIKQINEPYLVIDNDFEWGEYNSDNNSDGLISMSYYLVNRGWIDATNVIVELVYTDEFNKRFEGIPKQFKFDRIGIGERVELTSISKENLLTPDEAFTYQFVLSIHYAELVNEKMEIVLYPVDIDCSDEGLWIWPQGAAMGGIAYDIVYGIKIDANLQSNDYAIRKPTAVKAGEFVNFPLIFFANRSCRMTYYVEADIDFGGNRIKTISTPRRSISFLILSDHANIRSIDEISGIEDLRDLERHDLYLSFPIEYSYETY